MGRQADLERSIRESYAIVHGYEEILQTSNRPEEQLHARRMIDKQRSLIEGYLQEYRALLKRSGQSPPPDIAEILPFQEPGSGTQPSPTEIEKTGQGLPAIKDERARSGLEQAGAPVAEEEGAVKPEPAAPPPTPGAQPSEQTREKKDEDRAEHPLQWLINKGKRLWIYYLLWLVVSALGFVADLAGVLSMTRSQSLTLFALLALGGGVVLLGVSLVRDLRSRFEKWDRLLAGGLCIAVTVISGIFAFGKGLAFLHTLPTETPASTPTGASAIPPIPTPTAAPIDTSTPAPIAIATSTCTPTFPTATPTTTPTSTPTATATHTPTLEPQAMIVAGSANLRAGPGTNYGIVGYANRGDVLRLLARTSNSEWLSVEQNGTPAWIYTTLVSTTPEVTLVPTASSTPLPPPPTATPTPTATCTPEPTATNTPPPSAPQPTSTKKPPF